MIGQARVVVIAGTRPEVIKLAPIMRSMRGEDVHLVHTGQHFDRAMRESLNDELQLPAAAAQLSLGGGSRGRQIGSMVYELTDVLNSLKPSIVVVQGDTNSAAAGGLAANSVDAQLVHLEAGLRANDRSLPEERNRVILDHLSDLLCAPTAGNMRNLSHEGLAGRAVRTGNSIVQAVELALPPRDAQTQVLRSLDLNEAGYIVVTIHRPENTTSPIALQRILAQIGTSRLPVIYPVHPRVGRVMLNDLQDSAGDLVRFCPPASYGDFLTLLANARLVVSDSGGVVEECTVLKKRVVVVRKSTERPEAERDFARLVPADGLADAISDELGRVPPDDLNGAESPFGDSGSTSRIVAAIRALGR